VALIAALILALCRRLLGRWAVGVTLIGIAAYAVLVGAEASVLRAALMGGLVVIAAGVGRGSTALISLAVACWLMLLVNPQTLYDVDFQLSAVATLGLILFASDITQWLSARWPGLQGGLLTGDAGTDSSMGSLLRGMVVDGGVMTVAASILTLPLVAYHFQRVSLFGGLCEFGNCSGATARLGGGDVGFGERAGRSDMDCPSLAVGDMAGVKLDDATGELGGNAARGQRDN
jgi:competence protein ComEC